MQRHNIWTKIVAVFLSAILYISNCAITAFAVETPQVYAPNYILMDADTGEVLLSKEADTGVYPASTTKIMTIALALEMLDMTESELKTTYYTMTEEASEVPSDSSSIYLQVGEIVSAWDLLMSVELASANEGANAIAELAAGSVQSFVDAMNKKAAELGCENTNFANTHGYSDKSHYVSAKDMAIITKWALNVPLFKEIFGTDSHEIVLTNKHLTRNMETKNEMAPGGVYEYPGIIGGKRGYTNAAKYTLVEVDEYNGHTYIAVTFGCEHQWQTFGSMVAMFDYAKSIAG